MLGCGHAADESVKVRIGDDVDGGMPRLPMRAAGRECLFVQLEDSKTVLACNHAWGRLVKVLDGLRQIRRVVAFIKGLPGNQSPPGAFRWSSVSAGIRETSQSS